MPATRKRIVAVGLVAIAAVAPPAIAALPDGTGPWADFVVEAVQGTNADGSPVIASRTDPAAALGVAEDNTTEGNFYSLGFGGHMVLGYENKICNGAGEQDLDLELVEATIENPSYPDELVDVYVSPDNVTYTKVADNVNKDETIGLPASITVAQHYVKLVDASDPQVFLDSNRPTADSYDVDGVRALNTSGCSDKVGTGRMTGGGSLFLDDGSRVTHGFTLRCTSPQSGGNDLQVNWPDAKWHLESVTSLDCYDDPNISEGNPVAGFDTLVGVAVGRYNGVSGYTAYFTLSDAGEPGTSDVGTIRIVAPDNTVVLDVSDTITKGNQQAHHSG